MFRTVLTALDPRDHRLGCAHPLGRLFLGETERRTPQNDHPGFLLQRPKMALDLAEGGAAVSYR